MSNIRVYAFSGKSGSGKDFLAGVMRSMLPATRRCLFISLADQLKISAMVEDRISYERVYVQKDAESRRALQVRGTELGRNVHGADIWIRYLLAWLRVHMDRGIDTFFITDVRFPDELQAMRALPALAELGNPQVRLIRVLAPERTLKRRMQETGGNPEALRLIASHPSETALDGFDNDAFDCVLHNDPGQLAIDRVRDLVLAEQARAAYKHVVFLDLDDTLCECYVHYAECKSRAHAAVVQFIENSALGQNADHLAQSFEQAFDEHRRNYEREEFTRAKFADALIQSAKFALAQCGLSESAGAQDLYDAVQSIGMDVFNQEFAPLPGAIEAALWLSHLSSLKVVVVTVGERADQMRKLWRLGLGALECHCTFLKSVQAYKAWMHLYPAERYTMVGDSFARDIEPALRAGVHCAIQVGPRRQPSDLHGHICAADLQAALPNIVV